MSFTSQKLLLPGLLFLCILAIPATVLLLQTSQQTQSHASNNLPIPSFVCGSVSADIMLIIDRSGSMAGQKLADAKAAANRFIDLMAVNSDNRVGLASFSTTATLDSTLTASYSAVKAKVTALAANGNTCTQCAEQIANQEIAAQGKTDRKKIIVLLTDGLANTIAGHTGQIPQSQAETATIAEVKAGFAANKVIVYPIGLGTDVNTAFLQQIASLTGAKYSYAPTSTDLMGIYQNISDSIGKGSISGFVFNDSNSNGQMDTNEQKLPGWMIDLKVGTSSATSTLTAVSDASGGYSFVGLCDGSYLVSEEQQKGWTQTLPADQNGYIVTIGSGSAETDKNFGNTNTTPTITPSPSTTTTPSPALTDTTLNLTVFLHNIGNSGDNANNDATLSNKLPLHTTRNVHVAIYNSTNQQIADQMGTIQYSSESGSFKGTVDIGTISATEKYYIKIQTDNHLRRLVDGIQTLTSGKNNEIPPVTLVAGDANNDNELSLLDYNMLLGCYSDLAPAKACTYLWNIATDFNDDGNVNGDDFNLFVRELSVQEGQ